MKKNDPLLFFIHRLRDEAHRFAISTHRAKRKKALSKSYKSWNSRLLPTLRKFENLSKIKEEDKKLTDIDSGLIDRIDEQDEGVINE